VVGFAPAVTNQRLVGVVHHLTDSAGEADNIVCAVPGESVPDSYREATAMCDHCGLLRRRTETYIFCAKGEDRHTQVGRTCAAEYLGDDTRAEEIIAWVAAYQHLIGTIRGEIGRTTRSYFTPQQVIEATVHVIAVCGWTSRVESQKTGRTSTASIVFDLLTSGSGTQSDDILRVQEKIDIRHQDWQRSVEDEEQARVVCSWLADLHQRDDSLTDYLHNLAVAGTQEIIDSRFVGLLVSAVSAHAREVREAAEPLPQVEVSGEFFGELKVRCEADVEVLAIKHISENEWGQVYLVTMTTPGKHLLKWFTGENCKLEVGGKYHVKLTPDEHTVWNSKRETKVSRVAEFTPPPPKQSKPRRAKSS